MLPTSVSCQSNKPNAFTFAPYNLLLWQHKLQPAEVSLFCKTGQWRRNTEVDWLGVFPKKPFDQQRIPNTGLVRSA